MQYDPANPLIVQGDRTVLLEVDNPRYAEARDALAPFAELEKSPEHIHTYRLTPLSLWNAAAAGISADAMVDVLADVQQVPAPGQPAGRPPRAGRPLRPGPARAGRRRSSAWSRQDTAAAGRTGPAEEGARLPRRAARRRRASPSTTRIRGVLKQALIAVGYPAEDLAGYTEGAALPIELREVSRVGPAVPRPRLPARWRSTSSTPAATSAAAAASSSCRAGRARPSSASPPWPLLAEEHAGPDHQHHRRQAVAPRDPRQDRPRRRRWSPSTPARPRTIAPVTLATYQILTYRPKKDGDFPHFELFDERDWGLIIYDEVHLLPAPVFRVTAEIQARRRLGLTATLVREDGREEDVFSLIGPKKYDVPWRVLENKGWIAEAQLPRGPRRPARRRRAWSTPSPSGATSTASPARTRPRTTSSGSCSTSTTRRGPGPDHRPVPQAAPADRRRGSTSR